MRKVKNSELAEQIDRAISDTIDEHIPSLDVPMLLDVIRNYYNKAKEANNQARVKSIYQALKRAYIDM